MGTFVQHFIYCFIKKKDGLCTLLSKMFWIKCGWILKFCISADFSISGEISVETVKKGDKSRKPDASDIDNEISVTPAKKDDSDSDEKNNSERKIGKRILVLFNFYPYFGTMGFFREHAQKYTGSNG